MRNIILVLGLLICVSVSCTKTYPNKVESVGCDLTQLEHFFLERPEIIEKDSLIQVITNGMYIIIEKGSTLYLKSIPFRKDFQRT